MATSNIKICAEHDNSECEHYCMDCKKHICLSCTLSGEHSSHDHCIVEQAVTQGRDVMKVTGGKVGQMVKGVDEGYEAMKGKIEEQGDYARKRIDEHYNELQYYLNQQKELLTHQLNDTITKVLAATLVQAKNDVMSMKDMKDALEKKPDKNILSANVDTWIDNCLQTLKPNYDKVNEPDSANSFPTKSSYPEFCGAFPVGHVSANTELLIPSEMFLNETYMVYLLTRDVEGHYCSKGGNHVSMQLKTSVGNITTLRVKDNCDGSYVASITPKVAGPAELAVSMNGVQISDSPYAITMCRKYIAIKLPDKVVNNNDSMGKPWGVAVGRYGVWAVADYSNHCAYVFNGEDQLVRKIGSRGSNNSEFFNPCGVVLDDENYLYVADSGNHRVQKFNINGGYLLQFGGHGKGDGKLNSPHGITTHNGRVYVADYTNHRVSVFQSDGQFHSCFGSGQLGGPYDVAIYLTTELLVVDHDRSCVVRFTLDGNCRGKFKKNLVENACCLTTDVNGFVLLGQKCFFSPKLHRVCVFDQVGNLINHFGFQGYADGEFQSPVGIALGYNGKIYVSDHKNERVQIYINY